MVISGKLLLRIVPLALMLALLSWSYVTFTELGSVLSPFQYYPEFAYLTAVLLITGLILRLAGTKIEYYFPWQHSTNLRFGIGSFINVFLGLFTLSFFGVIYVLLFHRDYQLSDFIFSYYDSVLKILILSFVIIIAFTVIDFAVHTYRSYAEGQIEATRIMREQLNLQFDALKKQMSPHFLFNSLNTVSSLLYRNNDLTETFIRKLAQTYRSVLKYHNRRMIPLRSELELVESYGYLMSVRYEKTLEIHIDVDESMMDWNVPPLSIQMLVENAIKHNQLSHEKPLEINIYDRDGTLFVKNNFIGQSKYLNIKNNLIENPVSAGSHHIGLENIKRRYCYLTKKQVTIEKNSNFIVGIPLIQDSDEGQDIY